MSKKTYTIKQIADMAGVTTRTIRYYDQIDLLKPVEIRSNGYRYYDRSSLLRLQQIMFFRELDLPLEDICAIVNQPNFDLVDALGKHRLSLEAQQKRLQRLLHTLDQTIDSLNGTAEISGADYFEGFDQSEYEEEVRARWGSTSYYTESQQKWASYTPQQQEEIKAQGSQLITAMVGTDPNAKPDDANIQQAVGDYFDYLNRYFYSCDLEFFRGLADMWVADPRFAVNYERVRTGGAAFVREAVHYYCDHRA
jgi:DNA-binding transcriptional MerR regulator